MEEDQWIKENMESFGEYETIVRDWCKKHEMVWLMPEIKELFDIIKNRHL